MQAAQFVRDRFLDWERDRLISRAQFNEIMEADNQLREGLKLMAREGKPHSHGNRTSAARPLLEVRCGTTRFACALSGVRSAG